MQVDGDERAVVTVATVRVRIAERGSRPGIGAGYGKTVGGRHAEHARVAERANGQTCVGVAELKRAEPEQTLGKIEVALVAIGARRNVVLRALRVDHSVGYVVSVGARVVPLVSGEDPSRLCQVRSDGSGASRRYCRSPKWLPHPRADRERPVIHIGGVEDVRQLGHPPGGLVGAVGPEGELRRVLRARTRRPCRRCHKAGSQSCRRWSVDQR